MVQLLLDSAAPLETRDRDYDSTPVGWALHGAHGHWPGISTNDHGGALALLLKAGAACAEDAFPIGHDRIDAVLRQHFFGT